MHTSLSPTTGRQYSLKEIAQHQGIVISQLLEKIDPKNQFEFLRSYWELIKILDGSDEGIRAFENMSDEEKRVFTKETRIKEILQKIIEENAISKRFEGFD